MKILLNIKHPGRGKPSYKTEAELPAVPQKGDLIWLNAGDGAVNQHCARVDQVRWSLSCAKKGDESFFNSAVVSVEGTYTELEDFMTAA